MPSPTICGRTVLQYLLQILPAFFFLDVGRFGERGYRVAHSGCRQAQTHSYNCWHVFICLTTHSTQRGRGGGGGCTRSIPEGSIIVVKTRRRADVGCAIFRLAVIIFCWCRRKYCFFAFYCKNRHIWWMKRHPFSPKGGATCFWMVFHAILRLILKYRFCAISSREISVCAIFYAF